MTELTTPGDVTLAPGTYDYVATLAGYRDLSGQVTVVDGDTTPLELTFVAESGQVSVTSTPPGATVVFTLVE